MKHLIVTNRRIQDKNSNNEDLFGEKVNLKGASELRLAWAEKVDGSWKLELIDEPSRLTEENLPSESAFKKLLNDLLKEKKDCVFYVHGVNQQFVETLEQTHDLSKRYGVGVVTFSWPSNPGGFVLGEYKKARAIASDSIAALDRSLERLASYLRVYSREDCEVSLNLLVHSLGYFLFEKFVRDPIFTGETRIFDNVILNAADVDLKRHTQWTNTLQYARRVYATINERDKILNLSDTINPNRLGNTAKRLKSDAVTYFDLTDGDKVKKKHQHFGSTAKANPVVKEFFETAFRGEAALPLSGTQFDDRKNAYELT